MRNLKEEVHLHLKLYANCKARPMTGKRIAIDLKSNWRSIANAVRELRQASIIVGSIREGIDRGYYLPKDLGEKKDCLGCYRAETLQMIRLYKSMKSVIDNEEEKEQQKDLFA